MPSFAGRIAALEAVGYSNAAAMAKLAHDVVLKAAESCGLRENLAIKGGVVMSSVTGDVRRATMDMDIDFVRYGLSDENVDDWIGRLNCLEGITISRIGELVELRQQNYRGKRVYLAIADSAGVTISTKIDIGVSVHEDIPQREMQFRISLDDSSATLFANTVEQIFAEKLKSLLRLGTRSKTSLTCSISLIRSTGRIFGVLFPGWCSKTTKCASAVSRISTSGHPASSGRQHTYRDFRGAGRIGSRPTRHRCPLPSWRFWSHSVNP